MKKTLLILLALLIPSALLVSCNTMHGLGEDIQSGGKALSRAAEPKSKTTTKTTHTKSKK